MDKVGEENPGTSAPDGSHRAMMQHLVDSLASQLAVLDCEGNIILVNEAWKRFARENAAADAGTAISPARSLFPQQPPS